MQAFIEPRRPLLLGELLAEVGEEAHPLGHAGTVELTAVHPEREEEPSVGQRLAEFLRRGRLPRRADGGGREVIDLLGKKASLSDAPG